MFLLLIFWYGVNAPNDIPMINGFACDLHLFLSILLEMVTCTSYGWLTQKSNHIKITALNLFAKSWINEQWFIHHPSLTNFARSKKKGIKIPKSIPPAQKIILSQNHWSHYRYMLGSNIHKLKTMKDIDMNESLANLTNTKVL